MPSAPFHIQMTNRLFVSRSHHEAKGKCTFEGNSYLSFKNNLRRREQQTVLLPLVRLLFKGSSCIDQFTQGSSHEHELWVFPVVGLRDASEA